MVLQRFLAVFNVNLFCLFVSKSIQSLQTVWWNCHVLLLSSAKAVQLEAQENAQK